MNAAARPPLSARDLVRVVYSVGKVFDGLTTGRLATEAFLSTDDTSGISSRRDLELLRDLKDVAQLIVDTKGATVNAAYVRSINAAMIRSGALRPGELRRDDKRIGVSTPLGRHEPPALTDAGLQDTIGTATVINDTVETALNLFIDLAKAQPFEDGNKRTALFAANAYLLGARAGLLLTVPVEDDDPSIAAEFITHLATAYIHGDTSRVKALMRARGLASLDAT